MLRALPLLVLASSLAAQAAVSPANLANVEGDVNSTAGIANVTGMRYQQIHGDLAGPARSLTDLSFRRDAGTSFGTFPAFTIACTLTISSGGTPYGSATASFDANHNAANKLVVRSGLVNFPATNFGGHLPRPFEYGIPFTTAFPYDGNGSVCWELLVASTNLPASIALDSDQGSNLDPASPIGYQGTGCKTTGNTLPVTLDFGITSSWPGQVFGLRWSGARYLPSAPYLLAVGTSDVSFSGIPLPFEIPSSSSGASGPCMVRNDWLVQVPGLTDATGTIPLTGVNLPPPLQPGWNGVSLFGQIVQLDPAANALGLVTSRLGQWNLKAPFGPLPLASISAFGNPATGAVTPNAGMVVRI